MVVGAIWKNFGGATGKEDEDGDGDEDGDDDGDEDNDEDWGDGELSAISRSQLQPLPQLHTAASATYYWVLNPILYIYRKSYIYIYPIRYKTSMQKF